MKNHSILFAALGAIAVVACSKQEITVEAEYNEAVKAVLTAESDITKLSVNGTATAWENGDRIAVFQYGKDKAGKTRNSSKNIFTSDGTNVFTGEIAGYVSREEFGVDERFYAVYPADICSACGVTTACYKIDFPEIQSGLLSDLDKNAVFVGYLNETKTGKLTEYDSSTSTLKFLQGFDMFCITPILKFNVPASLNLTEIVLSAKNADGESVPIAGLNSGIRSDAVIQTSKGVHDKTSITVSNSGAVISGDVYVTMAPDSSVVITKDNPAWTQYSSKAKSLSFSLTNQDGKTATLNLSLKGDVKAGTIKELAAFPEDLKWDLLPGPGISAISTNTTGSAGANKFFITTEDESSTVTFSTGSKSFESVAEPATPYNPTDGVKRGDVNYTKFKIETQDCAPCFQNAVMWALSKSFGPGKAYIDNAPASVAVGDTQTYHGLTFHFTLIGDTYRYPYAKASGVDFMWKPNSSQTQMYPQGYLTFTAPETGTARMMFEQAGTDNARTFTVTNTRTASNVKVSNGKSSPGVIVTDSFQVKAGDTLKVEFSASVLMSAMVLIWEPETSALSATNESFSGSTPYTL